MTILTQEDRELILSVMRADRLLRRGVSKIDRILVLRDVIASSRIEGVDLDPRWLEPRDEP